MSPADRKILASRWSEYSKEWVEAHTQHHHKGSEVTGEEFLQFHRSILDGFQKVLEQHEPDLWSRLGGALPIWRPTSALPNEFVFEGQWESSLGANGIDWRVPTFFTLAGGKESRKARGGKEFSSLHEIPSLEDLGLTIAWYIHNDAHDLLGGDMLDAETSGNVVPFMLWHLLIDDIRLDWLETKAGKAQLNAHPPRGWQNDGANQVELSKPKKVWQPETPFVAP